jgi:transcriptional regulator with XRE-family HTH domain
MRWAQRPFDVEVRHLLESRGVSLRALARETGVSASYLSRLLRGVEYKGRPSLELARRVARAFALADDYFVEFREQAVCDRVFTDPAFRDRTYRMLQRTSGA